ncbi:LysR family transcriptional regulator [Pararhizobium haloflavum]|uniref:LysR family transcriptional regulator n=1 Tax=Pararhizobium haloflavum TaxID=2037914 RepID=UPI001FDEFEEF|nr:LysR family transcriptional regulator [Pararhizobium haloflavum]
METRLLKSFVCLAEELHFSRAAERLNIAQPALSRQIKLLEERLGVMLVRRTKRSVALTPAGIIFKTRCHRLLDELEDARQEAQRVAAGQEGRLAVSFLHSSTYGIMPHLLRAFRTAHPRAVLELYEMTITDQLHALREGKVDVGLIRPPVADETIRTRFLGAQRFIIALPQSHPLAGNTNLSLHALRNDPFISFTERHSPLFYARIVAMCETAGFVPRVAQHATQIHTIVGLVSAGMGVSILPEVAKNLSLSNVSFAEITDKPPSVEMCLGWRSDNASPILDSFVEICTVVAAEQLGSGGG